MNFGTFGIATAAAPTAAFHERRLTMGGFQLIYFPRDFVDSTLFIGTGGADLKHTASLEAYYSTYCGIRSGTYVTTGSYNCAFGFESSEFGTTASFNCTFGEGTGIYNITGNGNTLSGWKAGLGQQGVGLGDYNTFSGYACGWSPSGGVAFTANAAYGAFALASNTLSSNDNTAVGYAAGNQVTSSPGNAFFGKNAGASVTSGAGNNTCIGKDADLPATASDTLLMRAGATQVKYPKASGGGTINLVGQGASHTGSTAETTLATIAIPANALGSLGCVRVTGLVQFTGTAGIKTPRVKFGGTTYWEVASLNTALSIRFQVDIHNDGAPNAQVGGTNGAQNLGYQTSNLVTSSHDTTSSQNLIITGQLGNSADTFDLVKYTVEIMGAS